MLLPLYFMGQLFEDIRKRVLFVNPWELFEHQRSEPTSEVLLMVKVKIWLCGGYTDSLKRMPSELLYPGPKC